MPIDSKYGKVKLAKQPESMSDDEPVVVFRAQDALLVPLLARYENLYVSAQKDGFRPDDNPFVQQIRSLVQTVQDWQAERRDRVKLPD